MESDVFVGVSVWTGFHQNQAHGELSNRKRQADNRDAPIYPSSHQSGSSAVKRHPSPIRLITRRGTAVESARNRIIWLEAGVVFHCCPHVDYRTSRNIATGSCTKTTMGSGPGRGIAHRSVSTRGPAFHETGQTRTFSTARQTTARQTTLDARHKKRNNSNQPADVPSSNRTLNPEFP